MRIVTSKLLLPMLFSFALLTAACGGGSKSSGGILSGNNAAAPAGSDALMSMMAQVPDQPDLRKSIQFTDYAKLRSALGIKTPSGKEPAAEVAAYWQKLADSKLIKTDLTSQRSSFQVRDGKAEFAQETMQAYTDQFGYNLSNLDQDLQAQSYAAGHRPYVLRGRFDTSKIAAAVDADKTIFRSLLNKVPYNGRTLDVWGEDYKQNPQGRSPARLTGVGGRVTVTNTFLLYSDFTDDLKKMVDASDKKLPSLADVEELRLAATKLESLPVWQGELMMDNYSMDGEVGRLVQGEYGRDAAGKQRIEDFKPNALQKFTALAVGMGKDAKGAFGVVVYVQPDEATAAANEGRLKALVDKHVTLSQTFDWSTRVTSSQIKRDGRVLTLQIWSDRASIAIDMCDNLDAICLWQ